MLAPMITSSFPVGNWSYMPAYTGMPGAIECLRHHPVMPQGTLVPALYLKVRISRFVCCAQSGVSSFVERCFV